MKIDLLERVTINPEQCGGRPCIRNLRIRVCDILSLLGSGVGHDEILADYPFLQEEDIRASLLYAAERLDKIPL
ncbi:Uncharacterized conserved protein, DUF433 family [Duganella sp. CF402]|uniref:DUF433 domain-containing protein n=1 Tax=unclassified Duganella TaxID=2636909 RepID=UPI0008BA0CB7|nr:MULTISPECIES: DUF433 domain-containing protein [unclassified Duganella]RZT05917.1 uncharacterized protein (DUF433 family) [Duganella sp. BK701]SEN17359.1 Uncharacterized conserved protein, DUF433 family [Duganella sp. CF402]